MDGVGAPLPLNVGVGVGVGEHGDHRRKVFGLVPGNAGHVFHVVEAVSLGVDDPHLDTAADGAGDDPGEQRRLARPGGAGDQSVRRGLVVEIPGRLLVAGADPDGKLVRIAGDADGVGDLDRQSGPPGGDDGAAVVAPHDADGAAMRVASSAWSAGLVSWTSWG